MASWEDIVVAAPELAAKVRGVFDSHKHKVLATLRADGSPRASGTELDFLGGQAWLGSMLGALKARDLLRDPRLAIHCAPLDLEMTTGDVKLAGRAIVVEDHAPYQAARATEGLAQTPPADFHLFRIDITEIACTSVVGDHLLIEAWSETRGAWSLDRA